ncbi:hypothetical protein GBAR_LOCUS24156 [Geodia barretti]|uniref:Sushi domain-containing protein n=1 Tax=Geodia barretti TaxID=519541 RepID=A0AA35TA46_GEOBA|nr:hypothetical protein GBAR_LOCUS24156 [Geodia barretti]
MYNNTKILLVLLTLLPGSEPGPGSLPGVANITLVNVDKDPTHPLLGNLTSDLTVVVSNNTIEKYVNCNNGLKSQGILIKKQSVPSPIIIKDNITGGIGEYSFRLQLQAQNRLYSLSLYNNDTLVMNFTAEAGCRAPPSPVNGSIEEYRSTEEGAEIQFHCHDGYTPNEWMSSQCLNSSWSPHPMDLVCVLPDPDTPDPDDVTSDPNSNHGSTSVKKGGELVIVGVSSAISLLFLFIVGVAVVFCCCRRKIGENTM